MKDQITLRDGKTQVSRHAAELFLKTMTTRYVNGLHDDDDVGLNANKNKRQSKLPHPIRATMPGGVSYIPATYLDKVVPENSEDEEIILELLSELQYSKSLYDLDEAVGKSFLQPVISQLASNEAKIAHLHGGDDDSVTPLIYQGWLYHERKYPIFEIGENVSEAMHETDLPMDMSANAVQAPYPIQYIHYDKPVTLKTEDYGDIFLSGAYVMNDRPKEAVEGSTYLTINLIVSRNEDELGVANFDRNLYLQYGNITKDFEDGETIGDRLKLTCEDATGEIVAQECVEHVIKTLMFINTPSARMIQNNDRTRLLKQIAPLPPLRQEKMLKKNQYKYDHITISSNTPIMHRRPQSGSGAKSTHWRRGHYKQVAYGKGRALRKLKWIEMTLVNAKEDGVVVKQKDYHVRK